MRCSATNFIPRFRIRTLMIAVAIVAVIACRLAIPGKSDLVIAFTALPGLTAAGVLLARNEKRARRQEFTAWVTAFLFGAALGISVYVAFDVVLGLLFVSEYRASTV